MIRVLQLFTVLLLVLFWNAVSCQTVVALASGDVPVVEIITAVNPAPLETAAAQELAGQLKRLYQADVQIVSKSANPVASAIIVGNPESNSAMQPWLKEWPQLSDQGHCLRSVQDGDRTVLLVGGGSPVATFWAAAEFGHRLGIRSLLYGDLDPVTPPAFSLIGYDLVLEPSLRSRAWTTVSDFPIGPESWGSAEHTQFLRQLAKQKYNRIIISAHAWQPFVDYEFRGVRKQTGVLWYGWTYPVGGDTAGRSVFSGAKIFENPDFSGAESYPERFAAGQKLIHGIIAAAHELGMTAGLSASPLEFPKEFAQVLPHAQVVKGPEELTIGPGAGQTADDPVLLELATTQLRAWLQTYPEIDAVYLSMPEFPDWAAQAESAWKTLIRLRADAALFRRPDGKSREVHFTQIDPAYFSHPDHLLPQETGALHLVDDTARRVAEDRASLSLTPASAARSSLILTLADDNIGLLPQSAHRSIGLLLDELAAQNWDGFATRSWCVGDLDLSSYLISRSGFGTPLKPEQALHDLVAPVCGEGVVDRVAKAMDDAEAATTIIDQHDPDFSYPVPNMVIRHYLSDEAPPEWWGTVRDLYLNAMNEMYRANTRAREGGRSYTLYHARRFEFGFEYMNCIEAVRKAGIAKRKNDQEEHAAQLDTAVNSLNAALNAMAAVAHSNSDRGVIAVLNEYGYRPLVQELEALEQP